MINLDSVLNFVTAFAWIIFFIIIIIALWRAIRQKGLKNAGQMLISWRMAFGLMVVLAINLLSLAIVFIPPQYVGVVISLVSPDGIRQQPLGSGLHVVVPLAEEVVQYPIYWQTYTMSGKPMEGQNIGNDSIVARTSDGQEVSIDCSVIFRVDPTQSVRVHIDWQSRYLLDLVRPLTRGLVRDFVSKYTVTEVNSDKRQALKDELEERISFELEDRGFHFDQFLLRNISFSKEYAASVEQKQIAKEGVERTLQEAVQMKNLAEGRANAIRIEAEAEREALNQIASALTERPDLLTYRYIEKLGPSIRTMLIPNDAPFIIPLPTIVPDAVLTTTPPLTTTAPPANP